jgi:hypothetical protein
MEWAAAPTGENRRLERPLPEPMFLGERQMLLYLLTRSMPQNRG